MKARELAQTFAFLPPDQDVVVADREIARVVPGSHNSPAFLELGNVYLPSLEPPETQDTPVDRTTWIGSPNFTKGRLRSPRVIVIHTMETNETSQIGESIAKNWFGVSSSKVSAHFIVDTDSVVQCVALGDTAWAAPGANTDGIQVELAGRSSQSSSDWQDQGSVATGLIASDLIGRLCHVYGIPIRRLTNAELRAGASGIVGHDQVSAVYKVSDHGDPGPNFPWYPFLELVGTVGARGIPGSIR